MRTMIIYEETEETHIDDPLLRWGESLTQYVQFGLVLLLRRLKSRNCL